MAQYINKSAVIAKIRSLQDSTMDKDGNFYTTKAQAECDVLCMLELLLNILEVKEVDLEKEIEEVKHDYKVNDNQYTSIYSADIEWLAKHFFELGLKAQKGE